MESEKFIGLIKNYDPEKQELTIKVDFLDPDKQKSIEYFLIEKKLFTFWFKKSIRRSKTYEQLKMYYRNLAMVLKAFEIFPDSDSIKAFDEEFKKSNFPCKVIHVMDREVPLVPSKADMSVEEMSFLIQKQYEHYGDILNEQENN